MAINKKNSTDFDTCEIFVSEKITDKYTINRYLFTPPPPNKIVFMTYRYLMMPVEVVRGLRSPHKGEINGGMWLRGKEAGVKPLTPLRKEIIPLVPIWEK